jgi:PAS domain S-box-containing protein
MLDLTTILRSFGPRLTMVIGLVSLACLLAFGAGGYWTMRQALLQAAAEQLGRDADQRQATLRSTIAAWQADLQRLAALPPVTAQLAAAPASPDLAPEQLGQILRDHVAALPRWQALAIVDRAGRIVAASDDRLVGRGLGTADLRQVASIGEVAADPATGTLAATATAPIGPDGAPIGLVWGRLAPQPLAALAEVPATPDGALRLLIARQNWRGDAELLMPPAPDQAIPRSVRPNRLDQPIVHAVRGIETTFIDGATDQDGAAVLAATRFVRGLDLGLSLELPAAAALAPLAAARDRMLLLAATLLGVLLLVTPLLGRRVIGRLRALGLQIDGILGSIADGVVTIDKHGRIMAVNAAAAATFGHAREALIGQDVGLLMPAAQRDRHERLLEQARQGGGAAALGTARTVTGLRRSGEAFPVEIAVNAATIAGRACFVAILRDISVQHRAEAQLQALAAQLAQANGALEQRNAQLGQQNRKAHQFVDNVAHEFRTPLAVIKEYAELLRDRPAGLDGAELADTIARRAEDLNLMVNDMLDISRLEAGQLGIARRPCQVAEIVERCRAVLQSRARAAGTALTIALEPDLPEVFVDPEKIARVIINLVINALKFTKAQGTVRLWSRPDARGRQVVIGVSDEGPGIAPEHLSTIFERFRQVGDVRQHSRGFGLGLAITQELVELSFGDISVESALGKGSTFWFTVPCAAPAALLDCFVSRAPRLRAEARHLALLAIDDAAPYGAERAEALGQLLRRSLSATDLVVQPTPGRWLVVSALTQPDADSLQQRLRRALQPSGEGTAAVALIGLWPLADGPALLARGLREWPALTAAAAAARAPLAGPPPFERARGAALAGQPALPA